MLEREAMAVLVSTPGIGYGQREMALRAAGSAAAVLSDPEAYAGQLSPKGAAALRQMICSGGAQRALDALSGRQVSLVLRGDAAYPQRLAQIPHPPHLLFVWGRSNLDDALSMAVVGTRKATDYGLLHTRTIARELAQAGVCIVSGLALGIDSAAHRGALEGKGRTIAVMGGGLNKPYPAANRGLMAEIIASGGSVVSEYPLDMPPAKYSFLHRNRIIAGLSLGVLVTEGARRSGALRTANDALDCGREVYALPGDVRSEGSQLPHMLIAEGAQLITCAQDILQAMALAPTKAQRAEKAAAPAKARAQQPPKRVQPDGLTDAEAAVWQALAGGGADFDALCAATGISPDELGALLMMLELNGLVEALPGLSYRLA